MATSRPLMSLPSVSMTTRLRSRCARVSGVFPQAPAPRQSRIVDGTYRRGPGAAVIPGNQDNLGPAFATLPPPCQRLPQKPALQIYGHIYWRFSDRKSAAPDPQWNRYRDAAAEKSGLRQAWNDGFWQSTGIPFGGKMAAFTRFCPLRHLNLNFPGAHQIPAGYAKAPAGNLFDGRASVVIGSGRFQTFLTLSALSAVRLAVEPVHATASASWASSEMEP